MFPLSGLYYTDFTLFEVHIQNTVEPPGTPQEQNIVCPDTNFVAFL